MGLGITEWKYAARHPGGQTDGALVHQSSDARKFVKEIIVTTSAEEIDRGLVPAFISTADWSSNRNKTSGR